MARPVAAFLFGAVAAEPGKPGRPDFLLVETLRVEPSLQEGLFEPGELEQFCCGGCRAAYQVIHDGGLARYYRLAERRQAPVDASGRSFEEFDHAAFHALYVRVLPDGTSETELYLEGVHCGSCVWLVERVPLLLPGMASAELDVERSRVRVRWDGARTTLSCGEARRGYFTALFGSKRFIDRPVVLSGGGS